MKKLLLCTCLFIFSISLGAQNRWAISLNVNGGYTGEASLDRHDRSTTQSNGTTRIIHKRQPSAGLGVGLEYLVSQRMSIRLGVDYSNTKAFERGEFYTTNSENFVDWYQDDKYSSQQTLLRIPLTGQFLFGQPKSHFRPFLKLGLEGSYLLTQQLTHESLSGRLGEETLRGLYIDNINLQEEKLDYQRWQFPVIGGVGVSINRVSLSIERNWFVKDQRAIVDDQNFNCGLGIFGCFQPHPFASTQQLQTTYFKFAYRL